MFRKIRNESSRVILLALVLVFCIASTGFVSVETASLQVQKTNNQAVRESLGAVVFAYVAATQQAITSTFTTPQASASSGTLIVSALSSQQEAAVVETASATDENSEAVEQPVEPIAQEETATEDITSEGTTLTDGTEDIQQITGTTETAETIELPEVTDPEPSPAPLPELYEQLYNVPLDDNVQKFIKEKCQEYDIPFDLIMAIIEHESNYNASAISATGDYGLMQINRVNHGWMKSKLGLTDMLDPYQNVTGGMYLINYYMDKTGNDVTRALLMYQYGEGGAKNKTWSPFVQEVSDIRASLASKVKYV